MKNIKLVLIILGSIILILIDIIWSYYTDWSLIIFGINILPVNLFIAFIISAYLYITNE
jgi:hypothetical protein